jgi:hypothetical protein
MIFEYLKGLIDFRTDVYLDELAHAVYLGTNKIVHPSTIWRTLDSMNITNKNVSNSYLCSNLLSGNGCSSLVMRWSKIRTKLLNMSLKSRSTIQISLYSWTNHIVISVILHV